MKLKSLLFATIAGAAAIASAPVFAHDRWEHDRGGHGGRRAYYPQPRYYAPPRVVYAPVYAAPRYGYAPAPTYYYPAPVYRQPVPVAPGVSIHFRLPL